ncbi:MAG: hypothetical protein ACRDE5_19185, partial [Ginsengibacter sp.]
SPDADFTSQVSYGPKYYSPIGDPNTPNLNQLPTNLIYWREIPFVSGAFYSPWSSIRTYYSGGAFWIRNNQAATTMTATYVEEGQPSGIIADEVISLGGNSFIADPTDNNKELAPVFVNKYINLNRGGTTLKVPSSQVLIGSSTIQSNGRLQLTGDLGVLGTIRPTTNSDADILKILAQKVVVGQYNSTAFNYSGASLLVSKTVNDGFTGFEAITNNGGSFKVYQENADATIQLSSTTAGTTFFASNIKKSVGIGTNSPNNTSAILDISSTTKGVYLPRMTTTQRNLISTPLAGLQLFNTSTLQNEFYNGSAWIPETTGQLINIQYLTSGTIYTPT